MIEIVEGCNCPLCVMLRGREAAKEKATTLHCDLVLNRQAEEEARELARLLKESLQWIRRERAYTRRLEMLRMRKQGATLQKIADKYDLSRERVRQILKGIQK